MQKVIFDYFTEHEIARAGLSSTGIINLARPHIPLILILDLLRNSWKTENLEYQYYKQLFFFQGYSE